MHYSYRISGVFNWRYLLKTGVALKCTLVFLLNCALVTASLGQELEIAPTSFTGTPQGPSTTAPQALTLLQNTTGTTFVPVAPPISVSASFSNQQYTNVAVSGIPLGSGTGLSFGTTSVTGKTPVADNIYLPMSGIGGGANTIYTSNPNGTAGTGIDRTVNHSFNMFTTTEALPLTAAANGRFYYGNLTLTFNRPVNDPVIHLVGMGGTAGTRGFSTELEITAPNLTFTKLSGTSELTVNPTTSNAGSYSIVNNAATLAAACGAGAACGSIKVTGTGITSLTFRVYLRGDGNGTSYTGTAYSGDKWLLGVSLRPLSILSGTIFDDANGLTDNVISGTATNTNSPLYANLVNASNAVVDIVTIPTSGTYAFSGVWEGNYSVVLSTTAGVVGNAPPAASLPNNWVNTGEGVGATSTGDGTPNGVVSVVVSGTGTTNDVPNINFGIDQRPSSASATVTLASQPNPGGTATVPIATTAFAGSDPEDGTYPAGLSGRQIALAPATNGILYYGGTAVTSTTIITNFNPALVTLDPIDGAITTSFAYTIYDNALVSAPGATTVNVPFNLLAISGTIFDDANGLTDNVISGTATNAGGPLYVIVSNTANNTVVTSTLVPATGVYSLTGLYPAIYSVRLSTTSVAVGSTPPGVSLPTNFTSIGEGTAAAGDGTPNGITSVTLTTANITGTNFGIDQRPSSASATVTLASQPNPGGTNTVPIATTAFAGSDPEDGTYVAGLLGRQLALSPATNGILYYNGTAVTSTTIITSFNPALVTLDPIDGAITASFAYTIYDNALVSAPSATTVNLSFTLLTISGAIFDDANGLTDNVVSGTATNAGGPLYVILSNATNGTVVTSTLVPATGVYSLTGLYPASYSVRLSTTNVAVGATAPAVSLPANFTSIGEGTAAAGDGTPNGITSVTLTTTNLTGVNFGLDQLPVPTSVTLTAQANPGGTNSIIVPSTIPNGTDADGLVSQILYTAFPTNATSISIGGTVYTAATFPPAGVTVAVGTTLLVDPVDGAVTVSVPFRVIDNALQPSLTTGTITIPFTCPVLLCPVLTGQRISRI
jgi:hypothetical protein